MWAKIQHLRHAGLEGPRTEVEIDPMESRPTREVWATTWALAPVGGPFTALKSPEFGAGMGLEGPKMAQNHPKRARSAPLSVLNGFDP